MLQECTGVSDRCSNDSAADVGYLVCSSGISAGRIPPQLLCAAPGPDDAPARAERRRGSWGVKGEMGGII